MKKKISIILIAVMLLTSMYTPKIYATVANVKVNLPTFPVTLNSTTIDNKTNQYPLIVYKDITYFPMTYYDCRFLGLESIWDAKTGLTIEKTGVNWGYHKYERDKSNYNTYTARVAPFKIKVNGKNIDNSIEEYPLLLFRNVTYFPLTWRFAVEEFGWKYSFNNSNGLVISSSSSSDNKASAGQITLPIVTRDFGEKGAFTMADDYFYYEGAEGVIYQTPVDNTSIKKAVYELPLWSYGDGYVYARLTTVDNKAMLFYHQGGATMGTDYRIILNDDGTSEVFAVGYLNRKVFGDITINVDHFPPPMQNNLSFKKLGEEEFKPVGDKNYIYGWHHNDNNSGVSRSEDLYFLEDEIYVIGYHPDKDNIHTTSAIYQVNINTNATERICEESASGFKIVDDVIYFTNLEGALYKIPIKGGKAEKLIEEHVSNYNVLNGKIYYSLKDKNDELFIYGSEESINPGGKLKTLEIQDGYMVAVFHKDSESQYKMMIIDDSGKVIYKTMENVLLVRIENGKVVFVKDN